MWIKTQKGIIGEQVCRPHNTDADGRWQNNAFLELEEV